MKCNLLLVLVMVSSCSLLKKSTRYDEKKAVKFTKETTLQFEIPSLLSRYNPTNQDVEVAEKLIVENQNLYENTWGESSINKIRRSYRQYIGYYDMSEDKHLIVILLDMKSRESKDAFKDWKKSPIIGFGEVYERNRKILDVDLDSKSVSVF